jgi:hypothetical protein
MSALIFTFLELVSFIAFYIIEKKIFSFSNSLIEQNKILNLVPESNSVNTFADISTQPIMIHPYLGYVYNPDTKENKEKILRGEQGLIVNQYGFMDDRDPIQKKSKDSLLIGITGGSVAFYFSIKGNNALIRELKKHPKFVDKNIQIVRFALGGFKQPQQLMALNYLLSIGSEFDILINIDGFNEAALPVSENIPANIFPLYPRNWFQQTGYQSDVEFFSIMGKVAIEKEFRKEITMKFMQSPLKYSITANLLLTRYYNYKAKIISKLEFQMLTYMHSGQKAERSFLTGPSFAKEKEKINSFIVSSWLQSSLLMHSISGGSNLNYFHILQPNQYLPNSKILSENEKKYAFIEGNHSYKSAIEDIYPSMRESGKIFIEKGVNFKDLTMLFVENPETIYEDNCCHLNLKGNEILGEAIGKFIVSKVK